MNTPLSILTDAQLELRLATETDISIFIILLKEISKRKPNDLEFGNYIRSLLNN